MDKRLRDSLIVQAAMINRHKESKTLLSGYEIRYTLGLILEALLSEQKDGE